jgi:CelD/BcsL family acetyltransferase involved in cellulose biosynthesis
MIRRWSDIQRAHPDLASPYLHPEYTRQVAEVRTDTYVGILERGGEPLAFFPHHRKGYFGVPVGERLTDVQGVIAEPGLQVSPDALLRGCHLLTWDFDHLLARESAFLDHADRHDSSPIVDLSQGYEAWFDARKKASRRVKELPRKRRKLEREVGPVRFVEHTEDVDVLERVIELKRAQCQRTGVVDFMSWPWIDLLVRRIHRTKTSGFEGVLTALYAGDTLVAAHLGMRTDRVWHWWFPVYEEQFGNYSPGAIMLMDLARRAVEVGVTTVDLGKGEDPYKSSFANAEVPLLEGSAVRRNLAGFAVRRSRRALKEGREQLRHAAFLEPVKQPLRAVRDHLRSLRSS